MPKFEEQKINPAENPREAYEATEQDEAGLKAELAGAKNADEIMAIAMKLKAAEGSKNELAGNARDEADKEEAERKMYDEAKKEDAERTTYNEAKAEDATRTTAKETAKALDAELENLKSQIAGKNADQMIEIAGKMKEIEAKKSGLAGNKAETGTDEKMAEQTKAQAEKDQKEYDKVLAKIKGGQGTQEKADEKNIEKVNRVKALLRDAFQNIEKVEYKGNYARMAKETTTTIETIREILKDNNIDQKVLADDFFENTIGTNILFIPNAYKVYLELKGTEFAQRFKELEDRRLKEAGFGGFNL